MFTCDEKPLRLLTANGNPMVEAQHSAEECVGGGRFQLRPSDSERVSRRASENEKERDRVKRVGGRDVDTHE